MIVIEKKKHVVLDLAGVELRGVPKGTDLDRCGGWGVVVKDCEDVTIKGGVLGGYKGCIVATNTKGLVLDGVRFDGFYGKRLLSTLQAEDGSDWLYPHENDADQWITNYGAAISLTDCERATIRNCTARHGQNGILLTRSNGAKVEKNDCSFLSGWGLAMYRSSKAVVSENTFDYCVRGYSHGVYWRGQDSAGILMFERCSDNVFTWNSATHGGDGVFLFAGQDTVEGRAFAKGEQDAGGSDRNVWYENDFSFAVANAIEATFSSDNWAIRNRLDGSHQHGVWGGYSRRMVILGNSIQGTIGGGVSIEHGQECVIAENEFARNEMAIELWWDADEGLVKGPFGQHRDTRSRDTLVSGNTFRDEVRELVLRGTSGVELLSNRWSTQGVVALAVGAPNGGAADDAGARKAAAPTADVIGAWADAAGHQPSGRVEQTTFRAADPLAYPWLERARAWRPASARTGDAPQSRLRPRPAQEGLDTIQMGEWGPWDFRSGEPKPAQRQSGGLLVDATWKAKWFSWKDGPDPREKYADWKQLAEQAAAAQDAPNFTDPWAGSATLRTQLGSVKFGLVATTKVEVKEAGTYRLSVLSDDGVRVTIDGKKGVENWTWHAPTRDEAQVELTKGMHTLELEYFQIDGALALLVELVKL
ncbi:MAG: right-handed parallel beta-helix repeat-containing protein [Planctomycetes bacterium]|nr:right-handed parallel beta-helix repeat-containing protein [Planctomycetota bacterium]